MNRSQGPEEIRIKCERCQKTFRVILKKKVHKPRIQVRCPNCQSMVSISINPEIFMTVTSPAEGQIHVDIKVQKQPQTHALIAVSDKALAQRFATPLINQLGTSVDIFDRGMPVLERLEKESPDLLLVEAGLPDIMGYEVIDQVRQKGHSHLKIILLGSVSRPYRYHRPPQNLYGADAYIEPNISIPTFTSLVRKLLNRVTEEMSRDVIHEESKARRLARSLITDLVIYHYTDFQRALKNGRFPEGLEKEINKAREYYNRAVSRKYSEKTNYFDYYLNIIRKNRNFSVIFNESES